MINDAVNETEICVNEMTWDLYNNHSYLHEDMALVNMTMKMRRQKLGRPGHGHALFLRRASTGSSTWQGYTNTY